MLIGAPLEFLPRRLCTVAATECLALHSLALDSPHLSLCAFPGKLNFGILFPNVNLISYIKTEEYLYVNTKHCTTYSSK